MVLSPSNMFLLDDVGFCVIIGLPNIITDALFFTFQLNSYSLYGEDIIALQVDQATVFLLNNLPLFVTLATVSIKSPNKITPLGMAPQQQEQEITPIMLIYFW